MPSLLIGLALVASLALAACSSGGGAAPPGGGGGGGGGVPSRVTVQPAEVQLAAGATQLFAATVAGTTDQAVRWELVEGPGSIDASGLYRAPTAVNQAIAAVVRAVANADPTATGTARALVQPSGVAARFAIGVRLGVAGAFDAGSQLRDRAGLLVDVVFEATRLAGRVTAVTTGTLRRVNNAFVVEGQPTDRLVLDLGADGRTEFFVTEFAGDLSAGPTRFFAADHQVAFRVVESPLDATVTDEQVGRGVVRSLRGIVPLVGESAQVDVTERERILSEITPGVAFHAETSVRGTIDVVGVHVELDEFADTKFFVNTRTVEQFKRFPASSWTVGGERFELRDGAIFSLFVDGTGDEFDFWRGEGTLVRGTTEVGRLEASFETNDFVVRLRAGTETFEVRRIPIFVR